MLGICKVLSGRRMAIRWNMYTRDGIASYWDLVGPSDQLAVVTAVVSGKQKWNRNTGVTLL
jgi:hypothetical protein